MAALAPLLTTALVTQGVGLAVGELSRRSNQDQALNQLKERQTLQQQQLSQDAALERERLAVTARQDEGQRKTALRRAVARQRANFSAQGIGSGVGSSQAVLLGLFDETADEQARREELDTLRRTSIDQNVAQSSALNVLQRTQLQERNNLNNLTSGARMVTSLF